MRVLAVTPVHLVLCVLLGATARADQPLRGSVLRVDSVKAATELIIDVGEGQHVTPGEVLDLWRPYRLKHPVSGKMLEDRFLIGAVKVTQVGPALSLAAPEGELSRPVLAGDVVTLRGRAPEKIVERVQAPVATPCPDPPPPDPEAVGLARLFDELAGVSPEERAKRYLQYVQGSPRSRYAPVLRNEAAALLRGPREGRPPAPVGPKLLSHQPPTLPFARESLQLTVELEHAQGAVLYARPSSELTFVAVKLEPVGKRYFTAAIPATVVQTPSLDYFVEAISESGETVPVVGSAAAPARVQVIERPALSGPPPVRVDATLWSDFATFNTKKLNDWTSQSEGVLGVRLHDEGFRALRTGFGVYRGVGGTLDELDRRGLEPRSVGLTYGHLEVEWAFLPKFSVILRGVIGLRELGMDGGGQVFFRIGNDLETNLSLGGEVLGGIGVRGIAQLEWNTIPRVPIVFRSEVTNQPAGVAAVAHADAGGAVSSAYGAGDVGVRVIAQVGYRITPAFTLAVRGSYQGRTIDHAGPGGGAALSYQW